MDEIRRKRLERLGRSSSSSPSNVAPTAASSQTSLTEGETSSEKRAKQEKSVEPDEREVATRPEHVDMAMEEDSSKPSSVPDAKTTRNNLPKWTHNAISDALKMSFSEEPGKIELASLRAEREEEGQALMFTEEDLERLFWIAFTDIDGNELMHYLLKCWSRASHLNRMLIKAREGELYEPKHKLLNEIKSQAVSFAFTSLSEEDSAISLGNLVKSLISHALPPEFLDALVERAANAEDDYALEYIMGSVLNRLANDLRALPFDGDYKGYLSALEMLLSNKTIAANLDKLVPLKIEDLKAITTGDQIPSKTFLGTFFDRPAQAHRLYFQSLDADPKMSLQYQQLWNRDAISLQAELKIVQQWLFRICDKIVRASKPCREYLVAFFGHIINVNHQRAATMNTGKNTSDDVFMMNVMSVVLCLCEPFTDVNLANKIDRIGLDYFLRPNQSFSISEETRVNADLNSAKEYYEKSHLETEANFVSQMFYLGTAYLQYGVCGALQRQNQYKRLADEIESNIVQVTETLQQWVGRPQEPQIRNTLATLNKKLVSVKKGFLMTESLIYGDFIFHKIFNFCMFQFVFLVRAAEPTHSYPHAPLKLPLPEPAADLDLNFMPEYLFEAPLIFMIKSYQRNLRVTASSMRNMVICIVAMLRTYSYIKNPYIKIKMLELLFVGCMVQQPSLLEILNTEQICLDHLLHALMISYIEVEQTGASSQFYDKFNARYNISEIIRRIWPIKYYQKQLEIEAKQNSDFFIRFNALMLNDCTFLLDESLRYLGQIHTMQRDIASGADASDEAQQRLSSTERQAEIYMQLTNQTVTLFGLFTSAVPGIFVTDEIVGRLASMLDYNVAALVGPKCRELKVQNPDKYHFNPRSLLAWLVDIYLNLQHEYPFLQAIANDGRSFSLSAFERARDILGKWNVRTPKQLDEFIVVANEANKIKIEQEQGEEELGEIPEEFLDPLMYTLMENPVILPSSKVTIDLSTIKAHLLSDPKDPFNRAPLKIEDVIPNTELKAKITDFIKSKRKSN